MIKRWWHFFRNYFSFTPGEERGLIVLFVLIILVCLLPWMFRISNPVPFVSGISWEKLSVDSFHAGHEDSAGHLSGRMISSPDPAKEKFCFDPNTVSFYEMKKLGFSRLAINSLLRYRQKGGRFFRKEEVKKIYGIDSLFYHDIEPYIKISVPEKNNSSFPVIPLRKDKVELNKADSTDLVALPGIGPVLASRILRYRERLGGFYSIDQLYEVHGLSHEVIQRIRPLLILDTTLIQPVYINKDPERTIASHPYISVYQSKAIVSYRRLMGQFKSENDLRASRIFPDSIEQKIIPYIRY